MKVKIQDVEAVQAIRPFDAAFYLRAGGWTTQDLETRKSSHWVRTVDNEEYEVLLPMDQRLRDYPLRMGELLSVLAAVERRSQSQVYSDLLMITADVTRIRISDPELTDGTLPIEEHAIIAKETRELMLAAACAATERRVIWHAKKPNQATEFVRRVRIGQSERGSYIMTVITRITPLLHTLGEELFETTPPFERQVTRILADSLSALDTAAERAALTQQMTAFDESVNMGVSANLCDAVVGLWGGDELQRKLEFSFSWSPARPEPAETVRKVVFTADRIPLIREAARMMRDKAPLPDFDLIGQVVKLDRPEGARTGKVTIKRFSDEGPRHVTLELGDPQYHTAVVAHDQRQTLRAVGTLTKEGTRYSLYSPRDITVEPE